MSNLELGVIGNCGFAALIEESGRICWSCWPRFDSEPIFFDLLNGNEPQSENRVGFFDVVMDRYQRSEQSYIRNTAVLVTRLFDDNGGEVEITDFSPRFRQFGRAFRPTMIVRQIKPIAGSPRVRIRLRPSFDFGAVKPTITHGSNHIRYVGSQAALRLTTDAPPAYLLEEQPFILEETVTLMLGPDETVKAGVQETARDFKERTVAYWQEWVRHLHIPMEWQDAVIRAAITLKLCSFEETGAIIAAVTTSIPESANSGRNWDYRYCWLRDAFFVVRALNRLGAVDIMENYLHYLTNIMAASEDGHLQPVYGVSLEHRLIERQIDDLPGYRGMGPVRVGNQAYEHLQHDVYGDVILAVTQAFFDRRLLRPPDRMAFQRLEAVGERAYELHTAPDAGMWELRTRARVHTSSSLMCWAACDRLASIATHWGMSDRAHYWANRATTIHETICREAWNEKAGSFVESFGGEDSDASLLLMAEVGFLKHDDPRFHATIKHIEDKLKIDNHLLRYHAADDFGRPETAFNICTLWYIEALDMAGRREEAREMFENILSCRTKLNLLSEDIDIKSGELWGNFPQTYSLVGIINCAMRLSRGWGEVL